MQSVTSPRACGLLLAAVLATSLVNANEGNLAFVGADIIDGTGSDVIENGVVVVSNGRIRAVGPAADVSLPDNTEVIDASGKTIMPGMINAHGHVGSTLGLESGRYSRENVLRQLSLYGRYGVTTIVSLGDDEEAGFNLRDSQQRPDLD